MLCLGFVSCERDLRESVLREGRIIILHTLAKRTNNEIDQKLVREAMSTNVTMIPHLLILLLERKQICNEIIETLTFSLISVVYVTTR